MTAVCRFCSAPILWAVLPSGRRMPMDPEPTTDGNLAVRRDEQGRLNARVLAAGEQPTDGEHRGTPHFATCPNRPKRAPRG